MENNLENRLRIARMAMESLSFEQMKESIIYEFSERYKRQPGLFDEVVQSLKDMGMLKGGE